MRQKSVPEKEPATEVVNKIRRATRRHFSAEDKIRIVLEGLRGGRSLPTLMGGRDVVLGQSNLKSITEQYQQIAVSRQANTAGKIQLEDPGG